MKRTQLLVLLLVVLLIVTVIPAAAIGAQETKDKVKDAKKPLREAKKHPTGYTVPTIDQAGASPTIRTAFGIAWGHPSRTETYSISLQLYYIASGVYTNFPNQPIEVWWKLTGSDGWKYWKTVTTGADGSYRIYDYDATDQSIDYAFVYPGTADYYGTIAYQTIAPGSTETTIASSNYHPGAGVSFELSGRVTFYNPAPAGTPVDLWWNQYDGRAWGPWHFWKTVYTDADGYWRTTDYGNALYQYQAEYHGYPLDSSAAWWYSDSNVIPVDCRLHIRPL